MALFDVPGGGLLLSATFVVGCLALVKGFVTLAAGAGQFKQRAVKSAVLAAIGMLCLAIVAWLVMPVT